MKAKCSVLVVLAVLASRSTSLTKLKGGLVAVSPENASDSGILLCVCSKKLIWKGWNFTQIWIFSNTKAYAKVFSKIASSSAKQNHFT